MEGEHDKNAGVLEEPWNRTSDSLEGDEDATMLKDIVYPLEIVVSEDEPLHQTRAHPVRFVHECARLIGFYRELLDGVDIAVPDTLNFTGTTLIDTGMQSDHHVLALLSRLHVLESQSVFVVDCSGLGKVPRAFIKVLKRFLTRRAPLVCIFRGLERSHPTARRALLILMENSCYRIDKVVMFLVVSSMAGFFLENEGQQLASTIDFTVKMGNPDLQEKVFYTRHLLGLDEGIDLERVATVMDGWTWDDVFHFCKHAILESNARNDGSINPEFLLDVVNGGTFEPISTVLAENHAGADGEREQGSSPGHGGSGSSIALERAVPGTRPAGEGAASAFSDVFQEQLWQVAATRDYSSLMRALDNVEQGRIEEIDRKVIAMYPFVLEEEPLVARQHLAAAKEKMERIEKNFKVKHK